MEEPILDFLTTSMPPKRAWERKQRLGKLFVSVKYGKPVTKEFQASVRKILYLDGDPVYDEDVDQHVKNDLPDVIIKTHHTAGGFQFRENRNGSCRLFQACESDVDLYAIL